MQCVYHCSVPTVSPSFVILWLFFFLCEALLGRSQRTVLSSLVERKSNPVAGSGGVGRLAGGAAGHAMLGHPLFGVLFVSGLLDCLVYFVDHDTCVPRGWFRRRAAGKRCREEEYS